MKYGAIAIRRGHRWDGQLLGRVYSAGPGDTAKKRTEPYTKIIDVLPTMRRDTVNLVNISRLRRRASFRPIVHQHILLSFLADGSDPCRETTNRSVRGRIGK